MNRFHRSLIALLTLFLGPYLLGTEASASAGPVSLGPVNAVRQLDFGSGIDLEVRVPVLRALDSQEAERRRYFPADSDEPILGEREAVPLDPRDGRELVDRVLTQEAKEQSLVWRDEG